MLLRERQKHWLNLPITERNLSIVDLLADRTMNGLKKHRNIPYGTKDSVRYAILTEVALEVIARHPKKFTFDSRGRLSKETAEQIARFMVTDEEAKRSLLRRTEQWGPPTQWQE